MAHVIDFGNNKKSSSESYPLDIEALEEQLRKERAELRKRILLHGTDSIDADDMKRVDLLTFKIDLLCEIYNIMSGKDDDGA